MKNKFHKHYISNFKQICEKGEIVNGKQKIVFQGYADSCKEELYEYKCEDADEIKNLYSDIVNWEELMSRYNKVNPDPMRELREHMKKTGSKSKFDELNIKKFSDLLKASDKKT